MWLLILQFVLNFPSLIKAIIEIWRLIKEIKDPTEKVTYQNRLRAVLKRCNSNKQTVASDQDEINALLAELKASKNV